MIPMVALLTGLFAGDKTYYVFLAGDRPGEVTMVRVAWDAIPQHAHVLAVDAFGRECGWATGHRYESRPPGTVAVVPESVWTRGAWVELEHVVSDGVVSASGVRRWSFPR